MSTIAKLKVRNELLERQFEELLDLYDRQSDNYDELERLFVDQKELINRQFDLLEIQSAMLLGIVQGLGFEVNLDGVRNGDVDGDELEDFEDFEEPTELDDELIDFDDFVAEREGKK